jgi:hypothetical protein
MPWPDYVPVFRPEDVLISEDEYECGEKRTTVGWLKHLFLYEQIDSQHLWISAESRKLYSHALDKFCRLGIIRKDEIHQWEDKSSAKTQATLLNKFMRTLGYTQIEER